LKKNGNISKYLLKKVLYQYVPEKMFQRPKHGFSIPLADWLKGDLRFLIDGYLSPENIAKTNLFKPEPIEQMKKMFFKGQSFYYNRLWALVNLQKFLLK
jgi:asparagine synthase (glutamine-hydrolysing)